MLQKSNVLKPGDVNEASSKSSADEVDHDKVVKSNNSHDILNINVWQGYSIGGPRARSDPRSALEWPPKACRKWDKFAMTTPENTDVFVYMLLKISL